MIALKLSVLASSLCELCVFAVNPIPFGECYAPVVKISHPTGILAGRSCVRPARRFDARLLTKTTTGSQLMELENELRRG